MPISYHATPFWKIRHFLADGDALHEVTVHEPSATPIRIPERLVQHLWRDAQFELHHLRLFDQQSLSILQVGRHNTAGGGADFQGASLDIGGLRTEGAVEVHVTSGEWMRHGHQNDAAYNAVVLHVVLFDDHWTGRIQKQNGETLPELVLYPYLKESLRKLLHRHLTEKTTSFLCELQWASFPEKVVSNEIKDLAQKRLREKAAALNLDAQSVYQAIMMGLGYTQNKAPMQRLAERVPFGHLKQIASQTDREALLIGMAGLLPEPFDLLEADRATADYVMQLRERFEALRPDVQPLTPQDWQFGRLRPANFPTLRLAQAAALFAPEGLLADDLWETLFEAVCRRDALNQLRKRLQMPTSAFWNDHFLLRKPTRLRSEATMGKDRADALILNALLPALWRVQTEFPKPHFDQHLWALYEKLPAVQDTVTKRYQHSVWKPRHAPDLQGLHHLYKTRCQPLKCLDCVFWQYVLGG